MSSSAGGEVANTIPVPYLGMYYQSFHPNTLQVNPPVSGLQPNTGNTDIFTNAQTQQTEGMAMFTTNYPMSTVAAFTPSSLYLGCVADTGNGEASTPQACTCTFTGYRGSDNTVANSMQIAAQTFQYNPTTNVGVQQESYFQFLPAFAGAQFVTLTCVFTNTPVAGAFLETHIDTFSYEYDNCTQS